ncbi:MAG: MoaD/ThiS family protein [Burkholderiaceae bacterium]
MKLTVRYFASIREALGSSETIDVPGDATVGSVRDALISRGGAYAIALARDRALRSALNHQMCADDVSIMADAEVAFFPPVTGG